MRKAQWLVVVFVLGLAATLLGQPMPADAGRPFGTPITIRNEEPVERDPVVAYNSQRQEYLVVFWNDRPGNDDIRAERVSKSGQLLGGSWIAAGEFYDRCHPDAVYNPDTNQYLVVWQHYYQAAGGYAIHGRLLSATGQPLGSSDLIIQGLSVSQPDDPVVAYASTAKKYLVVWTEIFQASPTDVYASIVGQVLNSDGTLSGSPFYISSDPGGYYRTSPDLAYNRHGNAFLVVWSQWDGGADSIYGRLVNGDGSLPPAYQPFAIEQWSNMCHAPAVAAISTAPGTYKYLVAWHSQSTTDYDIYGRLVEEGGALSPVYCPIAITEANEFDPAIAGTEDGYQYVVSWRHERSLEDAPIQGRTVAYDGVLLDDPSELPGHDVDHPAVAAGPASEFLLAWDDQPPRALNKGIYGRLWGNRVPVFLPLILRHG
jgi:hypothetical protein